MTPLTKVWVGDIVTIHAGGEAIEGTGNHPYWVVYGADLDARPRVGELPNIYERGIEGRWVEARHIRVGDVLLLRSGESICVASLEARFGAIRVYNLNVADWHTYSVSTQRILVHNYPDKPSGGHDRPHGNSNDYEGEVHVYAIRDPEGNAYKIGESMQGTRKRDGQSKRAEQQVREKKRDGEGKFSSQIRKTFKNKADARAYETRFICTFRRLYGEDKLPGNKGRH